MKLTTDKHSRKDQRVRTQKLITETSGMDLIQKSCPKYLSSYARAMWTKLVPILQASGYKESGKYPEEPRTFLPQILSCSQ